MPELIPINEGTDVITDETKVTAGFFTGNLGTLAADIPANVYGKDDLYIYMNPKTYSLYVSAVSTLGYVNAYQMNGDYEPVFEGYKIASVDGMVDNQVVAAQKSNLFFGTDLISDFGTTGTGPRITLMDMAALDGSDNMRLVARWSAGIQTGVGADIVRQS